MKTVCGKLKFKGFIHRKIPLILPPFQANRQNKKHAKLKKYQAPQLKGKREDLEFLPRRPWYCCFAARRWCTWTGRGDLGRGLGGAWFEGEEWSVCEVVAEELVEGAEK